MNFTITFDPQLPLWLIGLFGIMALAVVLFGLFNKTRGSWLRLLAWALLTTALLNPSLLQEEREKLKNIVAIVIDKSSSQEFGNRTFQTEAIHQEISTRLGRLENFELREIVAQEQFSNTTDISTALFRALRSGLKDVPQERLAGAILVTDGQVHDIPKTVKELGINAPVHAIITGSQDESDRQIIIKKAPRYGVVGQSFEITYQVLQHGIDEQTVDVSIFMDGELVTTEQVTPAEDYEFIADIPHGGANVIELRVRSHPDELTKTNNRAFTTLNGIRENLRVLLVSGEPHSGERTWRNLLKSDASVDLVHFTILRPPEKQDGTPIIQLSLIAFPTRELFVEKIDEFDLIIFDRYSRRGVLPVLYFDNIARYVREGGAILIAAGPEFGQSGSIAQTPLSTVIPALPDQRIIERAFKPQISDLGMRHPVTRGLDNGKHDNPDWSRWFRVIGTNQATGDVVMNGSDEPLLVLKRYDEGRVALLLSDHAWLWARGFEGGGPHVQLLRRMAHWLMAEPELEEERLTARQNGKKIIIKRQTLKGKPEPVEVTAPDGTTTSLTLKEDSPGIYTAELSELKLGLYRMSSEGLTALVHSGPPNPREFSQVLSTTKKLEPLLTESGGSIQRVHDNASNLPRIIPVRAGAPTKGNGWIGITNTGATALLGIERLSLFAGFFGLILLLLATITMWTREGR